MKARNPEHLGGYIEDFLHQGELGKRIAEQQVLEEWRKLGGGNIGRYTNNVYLSGRKLFVKLTSPLLKNDLMMSRSTLVERLNGKVGTSVIYDIVFL